LREEPVRLALVALGQGGTGLVQERVGDLAADGLQLADAFLQFLDMGLVAGLGIRQPAFDLRLFDLQYSAFVGLGLFQFFLDFLFPPVEIGLVLLEGDTEMGIALNLIGIPLRLIPGTLINVPGPYNDRGTLDTLIRLVPVDNSLIFINFMNRLRAKRTDSLTNRFFLLSIRPV